MHFQKISNDVQFSRVTCELEMKTTYKERFRGNTCIQGVIIRSLCIRAIRAYTSNRAELSFKGLEHNEAKAKQFTVTSVKLQPNRREWNVVVTKQNRTSIRANQMNEDKHP